MFGRSRLGPPSSLNGYVLIVAVAGLAVLAAAAQGWATFAHPSLALWVLVAMALVTEVTPLSDHPLLPYVQSSSTSTPFVIAVLAQWGGAPAVIVGAASSLLGDVVHRRPGRKTIFNLAQYSLMYGAMAGVYHALGASPPFELRWRQVLTLVLAGAAGEFVNLVATQLVRVLDTSPHPRGSLLRFLGVEARSWTGELGIALVVLVISQRSPLLTVVLVLALLPIHSAFRAAADAQARRAEAEAARGEAEAARGEAEQIAEERARLIETRNILIRRMKEIDHQKDELLASVTHELRTPASSILGVVRTLSQDPDRFSPREYLELLGLVLEQAEQLDRLIGQLLLAARLQQPQFVTDPATTELADAATLDRQGTLAVLAVEDAGPGVPPQLRAQVFERFTQLDERPSGEGGGFGLGLYIARQLARAQGGEVLAVDPSRAGGGARFELRLPLVEAQATAEAEAAGPADAAAEPGLASPGGGRGRVAGGRSAP